MIDNSFDNKMHKSFAALIPYMQNFFDDEIAFTMSNTEIFLKVVNSENINLNAKPGDKLRPGGAAYECIKAQKPLSILVPKEIFGVEVKATGVPVTDENNIIVGSIVIAKSVEKHYEVLNLSETLSNALKIISQGSNRISSGIQNAVESNSKILHNINKASDDAKNTDEILNFVRNIAKQTNLLGLNASIESARAGEHGKGFSVVAKEIRKLSNSSNNSIDEINRILKNINASIAIISENINKTAENFKKQSDEIQEITSSIEKLNTTAEILKELAEEV